MLSPPSYIPVVGSGGRGGRETNQVLREAPPEFGHPPLLLMNRPERFDPRFNFGRPVQYGPGEMITYNYNQPIQHGRVPFEHDLPIPPAHLTIPPRYHRGRRLSYGGRPRFISRPWYHRRPRHGQVQGQSPISPDIYAGPQPQPHRGVEEMVNVGYGFRQQIPYPPRRRHHSDPHFFSRGGNSLNLVSRNFGESLYFYGAEEEYVPEPMSVLNHVDRVRRIRLESLETMEDSNGSNSLLDDEDCGDEPEPESDEGFASLPSNPDDLLLDVTTAHVAAVTKYVLVAKQNTELRAAFGVWLGDDNPLNFGGVMPVTRPQCRKAVLIHAGAECVTSLKKKGFCQVNISMESEYLVENVTEWLNHSKSDNGFEILEASNWDEYKYAEEISQLCCSFQGMRINWVHLTTDCDGIEKARRLARAALPEDYVLTADELSE